MSEQSNRQPKAKAEHWGLLIGNTVHPLPKAHGVADAYIACAKHPARTTVVYRFTVSEVWRTYGSDNEAPTQLEFDWNAA